MSGYDSQSMWGDVERVLVRSEGDQISRLGDGGPTCLTRPLLRAGTP